MRESNAKTIPGVPMILLLLAVGIASIYWFVVSVGPKDATGVVLSLVVFLIDLFLWAGLFAVNPNEARVVQLFGRYIGSERRTGLRYANPFTTRKKVSVRVRNFESGKLKVNDEDGNPIEIAAVIVWRVVDTAEAVFEVDSYEHFVQVQSEAALRNLASSYPYDAHEEDRKALRSHTGEIAEQIRDEVQQRVDKAGVEIIESRISHLAYAPEIASAMLQRQQAGAIIAARTKIVEGAVGMVEMALEELAQKQVFEFDGERKAAMISNLLVVLCSDRHTQPVVNTGSIYH
ncbi:MAG: SPFH domain-containing protein [Candidatus Eisenbacteria bacterium]|nr:SPFH domain-containing protein [Candidatus Latescibacterota bacterium]MBD3301684.1 SPFH domain-containing protein [Candidatus Eisenbacteria bacterium]